MRIRELRMGFPKTGKTKNVCETYPKPLLLLNFEAGGPDSINLPIKYWKPVDLLTWLTLPTSATSGSGQLIGAQMVEQIHCVDFSTGKAKISFGAGTPMSQDAINGYILIINKLMDGCPFQTVVTDPYTVWDAMTNDYIGAMSTSLLTDMKGTKIMSIPQWGLARNKKKEIINAALSLDVHQVFIGHLTADKNDLTGEIRYAPSITGKLQDEIGAMFSQVVVAAKEFDGQTMKYVVHTQDTGLFKNLGARFAISTTGGKTTTGPGFKDLYGDLK